MVSLACVAGALYSYRVLGRKSQAWWLLAAALALSMLWQWGVVLSGSAVETAPSVASRKRFRLGTAMTVCGAGLWAWASYALYHDWARNFDRGWVGWLLAAVILSVGLDLAWGRWTKPGRAARLWHVNLLLAALLAVAAVYRLGSLAVFHGATHVTQVEELQNGLWGAGYLQGGRGRWEFLSHAWLAALGIWLGGPTLLAMRIPFTVVSVLKAIPLFVWLRLTVGTAGAAVGTALFAFSFWDVILARIPTNQDTLIIAIAFALLAGPARRGRPSAYVWLGLLGGYVLYEYVGYRPLAAFVLIGATMMSARDGSVSWMRRFARPLITLLLVMSMGVPLFAGRLGREGFRSEYMDGWNRARLTHDYYRPTDDWRTSVAKRVERSFSAASLFFFVGDGNPMRNIGGRPLVDPVTATLLLLGVGYGIMHGARGVFGLTLLALAVSVAGGLVVTGNFDVLRASVAVVYVYGLVGYGAASVFMALSAAWARAGRLAAVVLLTAGVLAAGYNNSKWLVEFLKSPTVRRAEFSPLAFLQSWLRKNVRKGERVVGISPNAWNALLHNDGAWLRGGDIPGTVSSDIGTALQDWIKNPAKTLLVVYSGSETLAIREYLEWLLPGLKMQLEPEPDGQGGIVAYAHLQALPPQLAARLAGWHCRGVQSEYELIGSGEDEVLARVTSAAPFIDQTTVPAAIHQAAWRFEGRGKQIRESSRGNFVVQTAGNYVFFLQMYAAEAALTVDGSRAKTLSAVPVHLEAGSHTLQLDGALDAREGVVRLLWRGPDSGNETRLMPLYRSAKGDPACPHPAVAERRGSE